MPHPSPHVAAARPVRITAGPVTLDGDLVVPPGAQGIVLFAHGSGSSRKSPRNRSVAGRLHEARLATLLFDLLTPEEEQVDAVTGRLRFDIRLLADRLVSATDWVAAQPELRRMRVGYFGASTGGGAALVAAAIRPDAVQAVVSRGGRPDLAGEYLPLVKAPTLLLVGGRDTAVIEMNRAAFERLRLADKRLILVPGATHLFEEPGTLDQVAVLARDWFEHHLASRTPPEATGRPR